MPVREPIGWTKLRQLNDYCYEHQCWYRQNSLGLEGLVKAPQHENTFSEALIAELAPRLFGCRAVWNGKSDVVLLWQDGEESVEVKGTGRAAFQELLAKDCAADHLVWVDLSEHYLDERGPIVIHVLERPSRFFRPGKLTLRQFLAATEHRPELRSFSFSLEKNKNGVLRRIRF